jgi:4-hydroxybenzoate polyprenyltransferase
MDERFPPLAYGLMTALFVLAGISLSSILRLGLVVMTTGQFLVGFVVIYALFFQLRVADEWKDRAEDALYQSDRPVPRGLISLGELTWTAFALAIVQVALVTAYDPSMLLLLGIVWVYFFLMSHEFFCPKFLRQRPALYVLSHMFILVLSDLFITALDWWHGVVPATLSMASPFHFAIAPHGLILFLAASFANGLVIELGRKIRSQGEELPGVESYSKLLGLTGSLYLLLACLITAHILIACALAALPAGAFAFGVLALMDILLVLFACHATQKEMQKPLTNISNLSVLLSYLVVFLTALCSHSM